MIRIAHKIKLKPNKEQETYLKKACGTARFTWNWGLAQWKEQHQNGEKPSGLGLKKQFNAIKKEEFPWTYEVTKWSCQQPFIHLETAFVRFFKKLAKYPKFKKKGISDSFYLDGHSFSISGKHLKIPKLSPIKMCENLRFNGRVVSTIISRTADKWFASFSVELEDYTSRCESQAFCGIDLGLRTFATICYDNGEIEKIEAPKPLKKYLKKLKRMQRRLSRRVNGSNNRAKMRMKVARLHYKISCIRQDFLHKLTTYLIIRARYLGIEDLNVSGMLKNRRLSRSLSDVSLSEFGRQLKYKAELNHNLIVQANRWFPSTKRCCFCGTIKQTITLSDTELICDNCGLKINRDDNGSTNLKMNAYLGNLSRIIEFAKKDTGSSSEIDACGLDGYAVRFFGELQPARLKQELIGVQNV